MTFMLEIRFELKMLSMDDNRTINLSFLQNTQIRKNKTSFN